MTGSRQCSIGVLLAALLLAGCQTQPRWAAHEGETGGAWPTESWAKAAAPEDLGWSSEKLAEARALSESIGSTAVMIVDDGVVVDAWGGVADRSNLHSVRKSLLSALIGIAVEEGKIDLSDSMAELRIDDNEPALTEIEKQATVGDLIKARSGIYHPALYESKRMTASKPPRGSHPPGTFWHYNNWDFNTLGSIYEQETGEKIFESFEARIAVPLQMEDFRTGDGNYVTGDKSIHPAYPFRMAARDLARFGLLYLREGRWRDRQIVSAAWVAESTESHSRTGPDRGYGYMWWTGTRKGFFPNLQVPAPGYYAAGYHGQYAFVFPHLDVVVVHRVNTDDYSDVDPSSYQLGRLLWLMLSARGETDIGPDPGIHAATGDRLDEEGIRRTLTGATGTGTSRNGAPWRIAYGDGILSGVAGRNDEHNDTGTWRTSGDRYCRTWKVWSGARETCYTVFKKDRVLKVYDSTGTFRGTMTLSP